jgi:hypothetical protein
MENTNNPFEVKASAGAYMHKARTLYLQGSMEDAILEYNNVLVQDP